MRMNHGFICLLTGHREGDYETTFNVYGRHVERSKCVRCGEDLGVAFTGPVFPGEAENPQEAIEYIEKYEDYDPPEPDDPNWSWSHQKDIPEEIKEDAEELADEMDLANGSRIYYDADSEDPEGSGNRFIK